MKIRLNRKDYNKQLFAKWTDKQKKKDFNNFVSKLKRSKRKSGGK